MKYNLYFSRLMLTDFIFTIFKTLSIKTFFTQFINLHHLIMIMFPFAELYPPRLSY